jgi:hypothetical protein
MRLISWAHPCGSETSSYTAASRTVIILSSTPSTVGGTGPGDNEKSTTCQLLA